MTKLKKKHKIIIAVITPVIAVLLAFSILCIVTLSVYSPAYLGRVLTHFDSSVTDYKYFASRKIKKSDNPYSYKKNSLSSLDFSSFIDTTDTTSFIIVKNDEIIFEGYGNGYSESSVCTSFSMAKSVVSLLIGKAIEKGFIKNVSEPISNYISEFKDKDIGKVTIEELLSMRSDIVYEENKFLWFGDDSLTYWYDDLRALALSHTKLTDKYRKKFHYNNYHPLLLGIILERAIGGGVSQFFEREIWQKIGAEHDASWSLDKDNGFEKMESGINFYATDFIKLGSLILHGGNFAGEQVIDGEWIKTSTLCEVNGEDYKGTFLEGKNTGYKYMWYCTPSDKSGYDIIAWGKSDQILYISPSNDTVILRTGKSDGGISDWVATVKKVIKDLN